MASVILQKNKVATAILNLEESNINLQKNDIIDIENLSNKTTIKKEIDPYDKQLIIELNDQIRIKEKYIEDQKIKILDQDQKLIDQENQISNIFSHYKQIIKDKDQLLMNNENVCDNLINKINRLLVENNKLKNELYQLKK